MRWTPEQKEKAHAIVNDIAECIDNHETRAELRQALEIYADLFREALEKRVDERTEKLLNAVKDFGAFVDAMERKSGGGKG